MRRPDMTKGMHIWCALLMLISPAATASDLKWQDYELRGYMDTQSAKYQAVELALTNSLERVNATGTAPDSMILGLLEKLINVNASQGKYSEALEYCALALRFAERLNSSERTALLYATQGNLKREEGKLTEAELCYSKALSMFDENCTLRPAAVHGLARVKLANNQLQAADKLFVEALGKQASLNQKPTPAELTRYAQCCFKLGQVEKAIKLIGDARSVDESELGKDHPVLSSELNNLAILQAQQGLLEQSEANMRQAVRIVRQFRYRDINDWLNNLVLILKQGKKETEAAKLEAEIKGPNRAVSQHFSNPLLR